MRRLGAAAREDADCYLAGGATAVLFGWRSATVDVDLQLVPESDGLLRTIATLKDELRLNVELVSPGDFVPLPDGWEARSISAGREGRVVFHHMDPYAQALAKIERGHARDLQDVREMARLGLIEPQRLLDLYEGIEPLLFRYPALDPASFRAAVGAAVASLPPPDEELSSGA